MVECHGRVGDIHRKGRMLTVVLLEAALKSAYRECEKHSRLSPQQLHSKRSQAWVKCLGAQLKTIVHGEGIVVFCKADPANRDKFGLNEMLYDVSICDTGDCISPSGKKLRYIAKALWQVESEFAADTREAVKDFNKLVLGSAEHKLFIGPHISEAKRAGYLKALLPVACCCEPGTVYLAMVPHPGKWNGGAGRIAIWECDHQRKAWTQR
jgi:hypothetical protein